MWTCPEDLFACVGKVPAVNVLSQSLPSSYAKAEMMYYVQCFLDHWGMGCLRFLHCEWSYQMTKTSQGEKRCSAAHLTLLIEAQYSRLPRRLVDLSGS